MTNAKIASHANDVFIKMLKICDSTIVKALAILFKNCIS